MHKYTLEHILADDTLLDLILVSIRSHDNVKELIRNQSKEKSRLLLINFLLTEDQRLLDVPDLNLKVVTETLLGFHYRHEDTIFDHTELQMCYQNSEGDEIIVELNYNTLTWNFYK